MLILYLIYEVDGTLSPKIGHMTLIFGYVIIGTEIRFLVRNSAPVNEGETEMISYNKLCNGNDYIQGEEEADNYVWDGVIVVETTYANDTIPYYYDQ